MCSHCTSLLSSLQSHVDAFEILTRTRVNSNLNPSLLIESLESLLSEHSEQNGVRMSCEFGEGQVNSQFLREDPSSYIKEKSSKVPVQQLNHEIPAKKINKLMPINDQSLGGDITKLKLKLADASIRQFSSGQRLHFECLICFKIIPRHLEAQLHVRRVHFKERYPCKKCGQKFYCETLKKRHKCQGQVLKRSRPNKQKKEKSISQNDNIIVRNPCKNFNLKKTLKVKVKVERLKFPQQIQTPIKIKIEKDDDAPKSKMTKVKMETKLSDLDMGQGRRSGRLLDKKVDDIVIPFAYLAIEDDDDLYSKRSESLPEVQERSVTPPSPLVRPPLIFMEDETTLPGLSLLDDPKTVCHLICTDPQIPFDYILISGPPGSMDLFQQNNSQVI